MRPTQLPYKALYNYDSIASYVAEFLSYDFLQVPTEIVCDALLFVSHHLVISFHQRLSSRTQPATLTSPTTVLWQQHGNCFEYAILLCSLLEGAGYDAYVVSGYASRLVLHHRRGMLMTDRHVQRRTRFHIATVNTLA